MPVPFLALATGGLSAVSSILGGFGASKAAKAQASLYNQQADILEANAYATRVRGQQKVSSTYKQAAGVIGQNRTAQAKSGLEGVTAGDIEMETTQNLYQDIANLEYDNLVSEINLKNEAIQARYAAKMARKAGSQAMLGGILSGAGSLMSAIPGNFKLGKSTGCGSSKCSAGGGI